MYVKVQQKQFVLIDDQKSELIFILLTYYKNHHFDFFVIFFSCFCFFVLPKRQQMLCLNNYFFQGFFAIFYSMFFNINSKSCLAPNFGKIPMPQPSDVISNLLILKYFLLLNYYFILITIRFKLGSLHSQNFAHTRPRKFAFFHKARYEKY